LHIKVDAGILDPIYTDALRLTTDNALNAAVSQPVRNLVQAGTTYTFDTFNSGTFRMTAPASDGLYSNKWRVSGNDGNTGPEATIQVQVDNTIPTVSLPLTWSINNSSTITLTANAQDSGSGISYVQFYAGYNPGNGWKWHSIGYDADPSGGWSINWNTTNVPDQTQIKFFAYAWDKAGNFNAADTTEITLDRTPPVSTISPLAAAQNSTRFLVRWTGTDNLTGISNFRLQYQVNNQGDWLPWLTNVPGSTREAWFTGKLGETYGFRIRAQDIAGNVGEYPSTAQATTSVNPCTGDIYEPNNTLLTATPVTVDDAWQNHTLCNMQAVDEDWFSFYLEAETNYMIYTTKLGSTTETVLTLHKSIDEKLPGESRSTAGSIILITPQTSGTIYARVRHADSLVAGSGVTYSFGVAKTNSIYLPVTSR
jgi:hypothetical protein